MDAGGRKDIIPAIERNSLPCRHKRTIKTIRRTHRACLLLLPMETGMDIFGMSIYKKRTK